MQVILGWYPVPDMAKAKRFYSDVLGLKETFAMEGWAEFNDGKGSASVAVAQRPEAGSGATMVLRVSDLSQTMERLTKQGVKFEGEVAEIPGIVRIATFLDPFGNRLQAVQELHQNQP